MVEKPSTQIACGVGRKLQGLLGALALTCLLAGALTGCGGSVGGGAASGGGNAARPQAGVMSAAEAKAFIAANPGVLVLDVREPSEWNDDLGHIESAKQIPLGELESRSAELAPYKDKPVITVCRVGVRSSRAASYLAGQGFALVSNLNGGMQAWRRAGY